MAENQDDSRRTDAAQTIDNKWVELPPGKYIDELADFVEWIANARPEDEQTRAEIKRYYYDVGDTKWRQRAERRLKPALQQRHC